MSGQWTEAKVVSVLRRRFGPPEYALVTGVREGPGFTGGHSMDAFAQGLWKSRGLHRHGFEVKCARGDWLKEAKDPAKAERFSRFCHYWWIVTPDATIVHDLELPPTWGLIEVKGGKNRVVVDAPFQADTLDMTPAFMVALLRRATEQAVDKEVLRVERQEGYDEGRATGEASGQRGGGRDEALRLRVAEFEAASGITLGSDPTSWRMKEGLPYGKQHPAALGAAVKRLLTLDDAEEKARVALGRTIQQLDGVLDRAREAVGPTEAADQPPLFARRDGAA